MNAAPAGTDAPIVVGMDGSPGSVEALREGARLARLVGAPLEVLMCWQDPLPLFDGRYAFEALATRADGEEALGAAIAEALGAPHPADLTVRLLPGRAVERLVEASRYAQLLVVGPRAKGRVLGLFLGSVSSALVAHAHCPVLVARHRPDL